MWDEQEKIDENLLRDWAEMKKLQHPKYWVEMKNKIQKSMRKRRRVYFMRYAAIFVLLMAGCSIYFLINDREEVLSLERSTLAHIKPGERKATLHMSNGNAVVLSMDSLFLTESDGTNIRSNAKNGVVYNPQSVECVEKIYNTLEVPVKGEFNITLADGTQVWLNSCSKLVYPVDFSDTIREVYLEGEAFFDVTENKEKPFIVKTKDYSVRVLGTAFNIMDYGDEGYSHTTLARGKVQIQYGDQQEILTPGKQAFFRDGKVSVKEVDPRFYTTWMNDRFYFDSENLENIMRKLSRWYGIRVEFKDENAKGLHFVGSVPKYSNISDVCYIIALATHVKFDLEGDILRISEIVR